MSISRTKPAYAACVAVLAGCSQADESVSSDARCLGTQIELGRYVTIPSGQFVFGADPVYPDEGPEIRLHMDGLEILSHEVTNLQFERFVIETGYVTDAERSAKSEREDAGSAVFVPSKGGSPWSLVSGATWKSPEGPGSSLEGRADHPVVHVSLSDAVAYADWAGGRLPSAEEWEYAAASGLPVPGDPQSGAFDEDGSYRANTWQGFFPFVDDGADGHIGTAPAGCFPHDRNGVHDLIGNVWEWTLSPAGNNQAVIKGGSFLCSENFCRRYRPTAWQKQDVDFSASHIGFRVVRSVDFKAATPIG